MRSALENSPTCAQPRSASGLLVPTAKPDAAGEGALRRVLSRAKLIASAQVKLAKNFNEAAAYGGSRDGRPETADEGLLAVIEMIEFEIADSAKHPAPAARRSRR